MILDMGPDRESADYQQRCHFEEQSTMESSGSNTATKEQDYYSILPTAEDQLVTYPCMEKWLANNSNYDPHYFFSC